MPSAVRVVGLGGCGSQLRECPRLGVRVDKIEGEGLGMVQVSCLGGRADQRCECPRLDARVGDGTSEGLGAVQVSYPGRFLG